MTKTTHATEPVNLVPQLAGCPYREYAELRAQGGVHQALKPNGQPVWIVSRHADVKALLSDPRMSVRATASRHGYEGFGLPPALDAHLLNVDAADHARLRRLVSTAFTPHRVERLRDRVQAVADRLVDSLAERGRADLLADYAAPLPIAVICDLLGVAQREGDAFHAYTSALMTRRAPGRPPTHQLVADMHALLTDLITRKRAEPADDLLSAMIAARDGEDRLSENELTSLAFLILWAGYETTVHLIANGLAALLADPAAAQPVRAQPDPHTDAMGAVVEELLRRDGPVLTAIRRFTVEDVRLGDEVIPAGDTVLLALGSANRDPDAIEDPDTLDFTRGAGSHLGFGHGPHYCLGAPLARLEVRTALWTLLHRLPDLALAIPADELEWRPDYRQHALTGLPVTCTQPTQNR